jgi:integrase
LCGSTPFSAVQHATVLTLLLSGGRTSVLVLVLGLRKGAVLGLTWDDVDLDQAELTVGLQLQRVGGQPESRRFSAATLIIDTQGDDSVVISR